MELKASCSDLNVAGAWWKAVWRLKIPSEIKMCVWSASHQWIPTLANLANRKMQVDCLCVRCHHFPKSTLHALWTCPGLKSVRTCVPFVKKSWHQGMANILDFFSSCLWLLQQQELEVLCVMLWRIWFQRNQIVHASIPIELSRIFSWALEYISEFSTANSRTSPKIVVSLAGSNGWIAPA